MKPCGEISTTTKTTIPQKITFGEMRTSRVRDVLIDGRDDRCSHHVETNADGWLDDMRLSDIEPSFTCTACGKRGADVGRSFRKRAWGHRRDAARSTAPHRADLRNHRRLRLRSAAARHRHWRERVDQRLAPHGFLTQYAPDLQRLDHVAMSLEHARHVRCTLKSGHRRPPGRSVLCCQRKRTHAPQQIAASTRHSTLRQELHHGSAKSSRIAKRRIMINVM